MNPVLIVWKKEIRELLRDKRVRNAAIVSPFFILLLMMAMFGFIINTAGKKENQKFTIVQADNAVVTAMKAAKFNVSTVATAEEGQKKIKAGEIGLVIEFPKDFDQQLASEKPATVTAYIDPTDQKAQIALASLRKVMDALGTAKLEKILTQKGVAKEMSEPIKVKTEEVRLGEKGASEFLISLLPYMITIYAFFGGFGAGGEIVAGEKEKTTLETLLVTSVRRKDIAMGKFLALASICAMSSLSALMGVIFAGASGLPMFKPLFPDGLGMGPMQIAAILITLVPTVALFGALLLAVSTLAKNIREAQQFLAVVNIVVLTPAIFGQVIGLTDLSRARWVSLVPVLNTSTSIRSALQGKLDWVGLGLTVLVGVTLAAILIRIAVHLFEQEKVLARN
jgi:sodium transport system permease protein